MVEEVAMQLRIRRNRRKGYIDLKKTRPDLQFLGLSVSPNRWTISLNVVGLT